MRLLERQVDGSLSLRQYIGNEIPSYAILSHTWGEEEVTFQDLVAGIGEDKAGWAKIAFCAEQAHTHGLRYIWVDTCCIDRLNLVELSEAITSMFRWYQRAARCYVYLSDVSVPDDTTTEESTWQTAFKECRWFTRSWTLQELLAPAAVDFYSREGKRLGSKATLEALIAQTTSIAVQALQGHSLDQFTIKERTSWTNDRNATIEEDEVYCLLGVFQVAIPLIYGEGKANALRRLYKEVNEVHKGADHERYSIGLDVFSMPVPAQLVGRESELTKMHQLLNVSNTRSTVVLHGVEGIGKSELAAAYARRYQEQYSAVFWLNAKSQATLKLSLRNSAQQILEQHPSAFSLPGLNLDAPNFDQAVNAVKAWCQLPGNVRWLIIVDDYDSPVEEGRAREATIHLRRFLPRFNCGSVLITTQSSRVDFGQRIDVQRLSDARDGLAILSNTTRRKDVEDDPDARELAQALDGIPRALTNVGHCLRHTNASFSDCSRLCQLMNERPSIKHLLQFWAFFDKQDLWYRLIQNAFTGKAGIMPGSTYEESDFTQDVTQLCNFGFVDTDQSVVDAPALRGYSLCEWVHEWSVSVLNVKWNPKMIRLSSICVASEKQIQDQDYKSLWHAQQRLISHAARQSIFITKKEFDSRGLAWAINSIALVHQEDGPRITEELFCLALTSAERQFGAQSEIALTICHNLAIFYSNQGRLSESQNAFNRVLENREKELGPKHPATLHLRHDLAVLYLRQRRFIAAEEACVRVMNDRREVLGSGHMLTADSMGNLAYLYQIHCRWALAEDTYAQTLKIYEDALGSQGMLSNLPAVKLTYNFALVLAQNGRKERAEHHYLRALQGFEIVEGPSSKEAARIWRELRELQTGLPQAQDKTDGPSSAERTKLQQNVDGIGSPQRQRASNKVNVLASGGHTERQASIGNPKFDRAIRSSKQRRWISHIWGGRDASNADVSASNAVYGKIDLGEGATPSTVEHYASPDLSEILNVVNGVAPPRQLESNTSVDGNASSRLSQVKMRFKRLLRPPKRENPVSNHI